MKNIAIIEPSEIIFEGISTSLARNNGNYSFFYINSLKEIEVFLSTKDISVTLINPILIQNKIPEFLKLKNLYPNIHWIATIYTYLDTSILNHFNDTFFITSPVSVLSQKLDVLFEQNNILVSIANEELTEREIEILKHLIKGQTNKEVAVNLNISIHTVNTHRKNIMSKTGIRSLSGLTIYAVSKGMVSMEDIIP